ncbi:MAG: ABC transporter substrate-binding protein [Anaerolineae bacterium]|nr:ABC transporter substrate-binding protein [Anaerolineae bacterium]
MTIKRESNRILSRRAFLRVSSAASVGALLAACAPAAPTPTTAPAAPAETATPLPTQVPIATPESVAPTVVPTEAPMPAANGGTLVFAAEAIGESLEPGLWNGFGNSNILDNVYDRLTQPGEKWTDPARPALAESWEISPDGLVYTFKLRPGVKFHDGTELNADAVVRSLNRMTDPNDKSYVKGMYMNAEYGNANWEKFEKIDDMTVRLTLKQPDAAQLHRLFHPAAAIMSVKAMDEFGPQVGLNPVGAGPFKLEKFVPGQEATLVAFDDYWQGRPAIDKVIFRGYPDEAAMVAAIEAGEVNFAAYPPSAAIEQFQKNPNLKVEKGPPLVNLFLGLNRLQKPMDNIHVRRAINYAINRQNLIDGALYGLGVLPASFIGPAEFGYDPAGLEISVYDPEKARAELKASGLPEPVEITFSYENNRFWPQMAELIKADLEAVGFKVTLDKLDASAYPAKVASGETQLNMTQRSLWVPDPDNKVRLLHSSQGSAQWETGVAKSDLAARYDALLDAGRSESDPEKRKAIYKEIQDLILEDLPYVMLAYYAKPYVVARNVNVPPNAVNTERIFLRGVTIGPG